MPRIDQETVQRIKDTADIVDVVSDYVHLIRRGGNYVGLCPFHNERTPSFSVNRRKNYCYCFSCKKGGSPVNFIMEKEGLQYHEALLHLAKKYGIEVKERELTPEERQRQSEREAMFVANEWAMRKMQENLFETEEGKDIGLSYFYRQRGITREAVNAFRLGYALDNGQALPREAQKAGFDLEIFKKVGLIGTSKDGRTYDRYRGRVIFPILNTSGKVVGFGGRTLKNDLSKYINSPESEIYKKNQELYGIFQARNAIGKEDKCFLVEGYFDVIGMWQAGIKNVVASSGTALTDGQIYLIKRFTKNITLTYDGDKAGIKAALRGVDMLLKNEMSVKVLLLPDGEDPDSFAKSHTPEEFKKYVEENETDVIQFKAKVLTKENGNDDQSRINALNDMVTTLASVPNEMTREVYIQSCSHLMNISQEIIRNEVRNKLKQLSYERAKERKREENISLSNPHQALNPAGESTATDTKGIASESSNTPKPTATSYASHPLFPLEKRLMEFVVKYGYIPFCASKEANAEDNVDSEEWWSVMEYIKNELDSDGITIVNPVLRKIFEILWDKRDSFQELKAQKYTALLSKGEKMKKDGYEDIAGKGLSMSDIEKEEKALEDKVKSFVNSSIEEFERFFPTKELGSHEDNVIRNAATSLAVEPHQLSNIYSRDNNIVETEEDRLYILVPRAINELKTEILNQEISDLFRRFAEAAAKKDLELQTTLQFELNDKLHRRSLIARNVGDRIVTPWKRNNNERSFN